MKNDSFIISEDFSLRKMVESIIIDVIYEGYYLELIVQYEMEDGLITKFEVWTGSKNQGQRFFAFGIDNELNKNSKIETIDEMISLVYGNFENDNISFDEIIEIIEEKWRVK